MTVDGIDYPITEPRPFSKAYSSHKLGGSAGLTYEYGIYTHSDKLAWINWAASGTPDVALFQSKMEDEIKEKRAKDSSDFRIIADQGYFKIELIPVMSCRNDFDFPEVAYFKDRALSRHENFNGLTKNYRCLTTKFRHDKGDNPNKEHPRHVACVTAICVSIQCEMDLKVTKLSDPYTE